uniref:Oxysterol-binding protein n=1 Tax=Chlamydomonas euryale TaxID=1486919 RepID=A0A7R9VFB2_9CHLO|mmetsp:Transcript_32677/g.97473  ORF Transcript_32677/g.97473 Transcript_32677/m.97473 type:complete len:408 (+) Transcript_32677:331-1554(+)
MSPYDSRHQRHTDSGSASKQDCIVGDSEDSDCVATAMAKMSMKHHHNDDDLDQEGDKSGDGGWSFDTPEDKAQLKAQRAQLWSWLKSVGANIFQEGINLTKISLPVCLFEARSFLERITTNWDYLDFLVEAANADDPVTRMKWVVAFAIGGLSRQVSFHKPFNPILGETFQAKYPNGVEVFCEQISHHPPVSSWQVIDPDGKFMFYGNGNWVAGIKGNAVKGRQTGINCVQFADGSKISYELPGILVKGVLWGHRCIKYGGEMHFKDEKNGVACEVSIDPQPHQSFIGSFFRSKKSCGYVPDLVKGTLTKGGQAVDTCNGNWLTHLEWQKGLGKNDKNSVRVWERRSTPASRTVPVENPLASDARNREDVVHLKANNQPLSQEWKHKLEVKQRNDRKLRKEGGGYEH